VTDIKERLVRGAMALAVIEMRRQQAQDPTIGAAAERFIVERELRELAAEALAASPSGRIATVPAPKRSRALATTGRRFRKPQS
jgi:hypothetical protein